MKLDLLFASPVFIKDFKTPVEPILDYVFEMRKKVKSVVISNRGGWQSPSQPFFLSFDVCKPLLAEINDFLQEVANSLNVKVPLSNSWANINKGDNTNISHHHATAHMSGVYYLKSSKGSGGLTFESPIPQQVYNGQKFGLKVAKEYTYEPVVGRCLVFPAWLMHRVAPNTDNEERVSVAFNTW